MPRKTNTKTEDALILSKVAEIDAGEAVESLTAAIDTFTSDRLSTAEVTKKMAQVDTEFQLSACRLKEGLSKPEVVDAFPEPAKVEEALENIESVANPVKKDKFFHARRPDKSIDWRKMINPEHIVLNITEKKEEIERVYGKPVGELDIEQVDDKYKLILLQGVKEVADLRGFKSVTYPFVSAQPGFVSAMCQIEWEPFEGQGSKTYTDGADATPENTFSFTKDFLTAMAVNRAFVRTVKNFLKINLLGKDEIGDKKKTVDKEKTETGPLATLQAKLEKSNRSFEQFKTWWISQGNPEAETWTRFADIPSADTWKILGVMANLEKERAAKKEEKK